MSKSNRQRRKATKKAREHSRRENVRNRSDSGVDGSLFGVRDVSPPRRDDGERATELLWLAAEAVARRDNDVAVEASGGLRALKPLVVQRRSRALLDMLLGKSWAGGWQPVDIAHQVRRTFGDRAVALLVDAIAAEMRRYAPTTIDPQWSRQLRALEAEVWWSDDDTWLPQRAEREGMDWPDLLAGIIDVVSVLAALPRIQRLCPPPGQGQAVTVDAESADAAPERILRKVRALLAKAESTDFPEEAETLSAQAQQIIAKYSIDAALLSARAPGKSDGPSGRRIGIDSPYESPKVSLLVVVAQANRCRTVWQKNFAMVAVHGFLADLDAVELLYTSLLVQATGAMARAGSTRDAYGRSRTRSFRQSFLAAYAHRIGERLVEATERTTVEADEMAVAGGGGSLLPVLAQRERVVHDAVESMYSGLRPVAGPSVSNARGWHAGRAAADMADLKHRTAVRG